MKYEAYAWIGISGVLLSLLAYLLSMVSPILFGILIVLSSVAGLIFRWAFVEISRKTKNTTLLVGSSSLIVFNILGGLFYLFALFSSLQRGTMSILRANELTALGGVLLMFFVLVFMILGAFLIVNGIGFLGLKKKFKGLATAVGVLHIISGASFITFILSFLGAFTIIAAFVLEVIILFKADKIIKKK